MDSFVEINCNIITIKIGWTLSQKPADHDPHCFLCESNVIDSSCQGFSYCSKIRTRGLLNFGKSICTIKIVKNWYWTVMLNRLKLAVYSCNIFVTFIALYKTHEKLHKNVYFYANFHGSVTLLFLFKFS